MGRNYSRKSDPKLSDLAMIWDAENSDWRLTTLSDIKTLFNLVATDTVQVITAIWTFIAGISFTSGRVAMKEAVSGTLTTGWNKIAQTTANAADSMSSMFRVTGADGTFLVEVGFRDSSASKTHQNTTVRILSRSSIAAADTYIGGFRLGKSDSVDGAGAVLEVNILIGTEVTVQKIGNSGKSSLLSSWNLTTPAISTSLCADGVSTATFLEAGAEFKTESTSTMSPSVTFFKASNDTVRLVVNWNQIPKQATGFSMSYTNFILYDGAGTTLAFNGSESFGAPVITGNEVRVAATRVGAFAGLVNGGNDIEIAGLIASLT
jgi:hypothetical protein